MAKTADKKTKTVSFKCTPDEFRKINKIAVEEGISRSEYCHSLITGFQEKEKAAIAHKEENRALKKEINDIEIKFKDYCNDIQETRIATDFMEVVARYVLIQLELEDAFNGFRTENMKILKERIIE
jgi:hypothetical protein